MKRGLKKKRESRRRLLRPCNPNEREMCPGIGVVTGGQLQIVGILMLPFSA